MRKMIEISRRLRSNDEGAAMVEYGLLVALIAGIAFGPTLAPALSLGAISIVAVPAAAEVFSSLINHQNWSATMRRSGRNAARNPIQSDLRFTRSPRPAPAPTPGSGAEYTLRRARADRVRTRLYTLVTS